MEDGMRNHGMGLVLILGLPALLLPACTSTGIALKEQFGYAKREQLADGVENARDAQEEAKQQFASALEEFIAVTEVDAGELEPAYERLRRELDRSEDRAKAVRDRISSVERVAEALFKEWEQELGQYQSVELRQSSQRQLDETRDRYDDLLSAMRRAEGKMEPVLVAFRDQVLFLKHNLNARAVAALSGAVGELEQDIAALIQDMEASIAEANQFIDSLSA
jgi:SMC interacting uncharacterized protein involved in chromosome segregation